MCKLQKSTPFQDLKSTSDKLSRRILSILILKISVIIIILSSISVKKQYNGKHIIFLAKETM